MPGIDECLLEAMRLPGARGAALVDWTSGLALGIVGESPGGDHETAAVEAAELARLAAEQHAFAPEAPQAPEVPRAHQAPQAPQALRVLQAPRASDGVGSGRPESAGGAGGADEADGLGGDPPIEDLIVSNRDSYHVLRFVPTSFDSSVCLHLWLARSEGNLALARIRLAEMAGRLVLG
ncbi:hypothetical protein [Streptomyces sp. NPDC050287]|uniref:hypothetical protein n=1 Tax=Streptomyces sp. NPDC050287 TaxID=3365608 RepID=UPI0037AADE31